MELRDGRLDAMVPAARRFPLPDRLQADATLQGLRGLDAWAAVRPDEAVDGPVPAPADEPYAEKLVVPEPVAPASAEELHLARMQPIPPEAKALCKPGAAQSAA